MDDLNQNYQLRYLPIFYEDLYEKLEYISDVLNNKKAALDLIHAIENAIFERLPIAESFEKYLSSKERPHPYYRIHVRNFIIFYVVIEEETGNKVMEIRRFLYNKQNRNNFL